MGVAPFLSLYHTLPDLSLNQAPYLGDRWERGHARV